MPGHDYQMLAPLRSPSRPVRTPARRSPAPWPGSPRISAGSAEVIRDRPGGWEAALVADLLSGTVGPGDENLPMFGITS